MVKEMTESQKVAALKAYRNSLIDQSEAVSDYFLSVSQVSLIHFYTG